MLKFFFVSAALQIKKTAIIKQYLRLFESRFLVPKKMTLSNKFYNNIRQKCNATFLLTEPANPVF